MTGARAVAAVVAYLRLGQPSAAPATGYCPLLALAPRRLTDNEIDSLARYFATQCDLSVSDIDIAAAIMCITDNFAERADIGRVRQSLPSTQ